MVSSSRGPGRGVWRGAGTASTLTWASAGRICPWPATWSWRLGSSTWWVEHDVATDSHRPTHTHRRGWGGTRFGRCCALRNEGGKAALQGICGACASRCSSRRSRFLGARQTRSRNRSASLTYSRFQRPRCSWSCCTICGVSASGEPIRETSVPARREKLEWQTASTKHHNNDSGCWAAVRGARNCAERSVRTAWR
jgi:hypothetical protein